MAATQKTKTHKPEHTNPKHSNQKHTNQNNDNVLTGNMQQSDTLSLPHPLKWQRTGKEACITTECAIVVSRQMALYSLTNLAKHICHIGLDKKIYKGWLQSYVCFSHESGYDEVPGTSMPEEPCHSPFFIAQSRQFYEGWEEHETFEEVFGTSGPDCYIEICVISHFYQLEHHQISRYIMAMFIYGVIESSSDLLLVPTPFRITKFLLEFATLIESLEKQHNVRCARKKNKYYEEALLALHLYTEGVQVRTEARERTRKKNKQSTHSLSQLLNYSNAIVEEQEENKNAIDMTKLPVDMESEVRHERMTDLHSETDSVPSPASIFLETYAEGDDDALIYDLYTPKFNKVLQYTLPYELDDVISDMPVTFSTPSRSHLYTRSN